MSSKKNPKKNVAKTKTVWGGRKLPIIDPEVVKVLLWIKLAKLKSSLGLTENISIEDMANKFKQLDEEIRKKENSQKNSIGKSIRRNKERVKKREIFNAKKNARLLKEQEYLRAEKLIKSENFEKYVESMIVSIMLVRSNFAKNPESLLNQDSLKSAKRYSSYFKEFYLFHPSKQIRTLARQKYDIVAKRKGFIL